jgi:hypothetical protein
MNKLVWGCWWGGNLLIVLAWLRKVPVEVGWAGFVIAFSAFLAPGLIRRYGRRGGPNDSREDREAHEDGEESGQ